MMQVYVSATNVETGRVKVFNRSELTADMVMASACLPFVFQAVEIDGVPYWDGGYMGNPALFPFFSGSACDDVVIVQINPSNARAHRARRRTSPTASTRSASRSPDPHPA
jgi:NTE family protein